MYTAKASSAWKWPLWVPMVTGEVLSLFALASAILRVLRIIKDTWEGGVGWLSFEYNFGEGGLAMQLNLTK